MIVIGRYFDPAHVARYCFEIDIESERKAVIAKDAKNGTYCLRVCNGTMHSDLYMGKEVLEVLPFLIAHVLNNDEKFEVAEDES